MHACQPLYLKKKLNMPQPRNELQICECPRDSCDGTVQLKLRHIHLVFQYRVHGACSKLCIGRLWEACSASLLGCTASFGLYDIERLWTFLELLSYLQLYRLQFESYAEACSWVSGLAPFKDKAVMCVQSMKQRDPRIHFALVCGAKSCPPIKVSQIGLSDTIQNSGHALYCYLRNLVRQAITCSFCGR